MDTIKLEDFISETIQGLVNGVEDARPKIKEKGAKIIVASHLGRPKGKVEPKLSLDPVAKKFEDITGKKIKKFDQIYSPEIK